MMRTMERERILVALWSPRALPVLRVLPVLCGRVLRVLPCAG